VVKKLVPVVVLAVGVFAAAQASAVPFTDPSTGVVYDATYQLMSSGGGNSTYLIDVTANTSTYNVDASGDVLNSIAIKIASSVSSFSLVSGPAGSVSEAGGISSGGCNGAGAGFVCDQFTPIAVPDGTVEVKFSETIATGSLLTGTNQASLKAAYETATGQNAAITSQDFTLSAVPIPTPEPATLLFVGTGLVGLASRAWRRVRR
jgi:PEP-CTERM motif-containing protein